MMNSFAAIYFHNYLRLDEMPIPVTSSTKAISIKYPEKDAEHAIIADSADDQSQIKDNFDVKTNLVNHEVVNSAASFRIDGNEEG